MAKYKFSRQKENKHTTIWCCKMIRFESFSYTVLCMYVEKRKEEDDPYQKFH